MTDYLTSVQIMDSKQYLTAKRKGRFMDLLVTKIEERSRPTQARNRFIRATQKTALDFMEYQSVMCLDQVATVNEYPWIYTNAGVLAEACAHWAFIAHPELRVNDDFWES